MGRGDAAPTSGDTGGDSSSGSLAQLAALSSSAIATLIAIATDPQQWLRQIINKWIVGGILDAASYLLGWLIFAYERTSSIILDAAGPLATPFSILEDAIVGGIESLYNLALGGAQTLGLAGPPAAAFAIALISLLLAAVVYATWRTIPGSDAVGGALEAIR